MVRVGVVGASGYTGLELIKMIIKHPKFKLTYLATSQGNQRVEKIHPTLNGVLEAEVEKANPTTAIKRCDLVFLALPHKESMKFAKDLIDANIKVVDLSADYRLQKETYEAHYSPHLDSKNLNKSVYGLIEYYREEIKTSSLVASPGCYPTATLLGILPFMPYIDSTIPLFIDAKSGVSGAGKKLSYNTHFVTINENIFAYNPLKHRHAPEIAEKIKDISNIDIQINFVPHLIPTTRGELVSVYALLKEEIDPLEVLNRRYANEKFIRVKDKPVDIKSTAGTHFCDIYASKNGRALFVSCAIDNLLRGASSQALVAGNLMLGLDEELGVPTISYMP